jgi:hypothetical protein
MAGLGGGEAGALSAPAGTLPTSGLGLAATAGETTGRGGGLAPGIRPGWTTDVATEPVSGARGGAPQAMAATSPSVISARPTSTRSSALRLLFQRAKHVRMRLKAGPSFRPRA